MRIFVFMAEICKVYVNDGVGRFVHTKANLMYTTPNIALC